MKDIEHHMLQFLDNHDEQRLASPRICRDSRKGKPLMVVSQQSVQRPDLFWSGSGRGLMKMEVSAHIPELQFFDYVGVKSSALDE
jgi:hypothetical protein